MNSQTLRLAGGAALALALGAPSAFGVTITEIFYHPRASDEAALGGRNLEWIEIYNEDPTVLDLSGYHFSAGIVFTFPEDTYLEGRSYLVVCADVEAVRAKYGIENAIGNFLGRLDNGGERIELSIYGGGPEAVVEYSDRNQWPQAADGTGHSLVLKDVYADPSNNDNWTWSAALGGTPGRPNFEEPERVQTTIVPDDALWRYAKGTAPYPAGWRSLEFDDSAWLSGPTGIGYGDGDDRTVLSDMRGNYWSIAARHVFDLAREELDALGDLYLEIAYDDGFVMHLNGVEIARGALGNPGEEVPHNAAAGLHDANEFESFAFPKSLLRAGGNVLAAQVHNNTLGSSDLSFIPRIVSVRTMGPGASGRRFPVVLNECFPNDGSGGWIELFNASSAPADLSGFRLSDDRGDLGKWTFPAGSVVPARGFLVVRESDCGFDFSSAEIAVYLVRPDLSEVVAAELFENPPGGDPLLLGTSRARHPDGVGRFFVSTAPTPGAPNQAALETDVVIHEILYNPPPGRSGLEFVELYNRGPAPVDLSGFRFARGVRYVFPPGTTIPAGGYLVVARDPRALEEAHGISGVLGPYEGSLANEGELVRLVDRRGNLADEVRYEDGGRWPAWADGLGSSLELLDPRQDNSVASAWEASDESAKSRWEEASFTVSYAQQQESEFHIRMLVPGEILVDDVRVTRGATQYIPNGGFESSTAGWIIEGNHVRSHRTTEDSFEGRACLKVVATGRGDNRVNRIETETSPAMTSGTYDVHVALKWLRGGNLVYFSNFADPPLSQKTYALAYPPNLGSPAARNGVAVENLGPVISGVRHSPAVPGGSQETRVFARVSDADGVAWARARYRTGSPAGVFLAADLYDDGAHEDGEAGDGLYAGTIPGQSVGVAVVFYVEAEDSLGAWRAFPREAPERTLVYRHDAGFSARGFAYRVIHDDATWSALNSRPLHSNELLDATFVFEESRVYYNVGTRYRGSPWNRPGDPRMYRIRFPEDDAFRGRRSLNLSRYGNAQRERAAYYAIWRNSTPETAAPMSRSAFARVRTRAGTYTMEHIEPVNQEYLRLWFPADPDGWLYKVNGWQVFDDAGNILTGLIRWASYEYKGTNKAEYRWNFCPRTWELEDNFEPVMRLLQTMAGSAAVLDSELETIMDVEQFLRVYAASCAADDWDKIAIGNGQNAYLYYAPLEGRFKLIPWDLDHTFDTARISAARVYPDADARFRNVVARPKYRRMYLGILNEMVNGRGGRPGYWSSSEMVAKVLDRNTAVVGPDGVADASSIRTYVDGRRSVLASQIPARVAFSVTTNGGAPLTVADVRATIEGNAWVDVYSIVVGEEAASPDWVTTTRWRIAVDLDYGPNDLVFLAFDVEGRLVGSASIRVTSTAGWPAPVISAIEPPAAMPGEAVAIAGSEFHAGARVFFGAAEAEVVRVEEGSASARIEARVPYLPPGDVGVAVLNADGRRSKAFPFVVLALPQRFVRGDGNLDRTVDVSDAVFVLGHLFRGLDARCLDALDANGDRSVDLADAITVLEYLFRDGPAPPPPFPEPGTDPRGAEGLGCREGVGP